MIINDNLETALKGFLWKASDKLRAVSDSREYGSLTMRMLYCAYVSANRSRLGLDDFDDKYLIEAVPDNIGDAYVAKDLLLYYGALEPKSRFPQLSANLPSTESLRRFVVGWVSAFVASGIDLKEDDGGNVSRAICSAVAELELPERYGRFGGELHSTSSLTDLVVGLADVEGKEVLDFTCGAGSFLCKAAEAKATHLIGRDINPKAVDLAKMACFFANGGVSADISIHDAMSPNPDLAGKADRVLTAPPIGMRVKFAPGTKSYIAETTEKLFGKPIALTMFEDFSVVKAIDCLSDDGIAVIQVAPGFLFQEKRDRAALRQALVSSGCLQSVVELPSGTYYGSNIKSALLVLGKKRRFDDVLITNVDSEEIAAKGLYTRARGRTCQFSNRGVEWICELVRSRREEDRVSALVSTSDLSEKGYDLCYATYGGVIDIDEVLNNTRKPGTILVDINDALTAVTHLGANIEKLVDAIELEG